MNATETTTQQYLSFDHPFSGPVILGLGLLCVGLLLWSLYRERYVLGARTTSFFFVLRVLAVATVFWMLLAPNNVLEVSTSTRKAVLMLTDVSASMTTVDPAGRADDIRWATFGSPPDAGTSVAAAIATADRAIAALGVADRQLAQALEDLEAHGAQSLVTEHLVRASQAIARAQSHCGRARVQASELASGGIDTADIDPILTRISSLVESPEFDALIELAETLRRGRTPSEAGWREGLPDLRGRTVTSRRVFGQLADQWVAIERSGKRDGELTPKTFQSRSRSQRVASFLGQLQENSLSSISEVADLHWRSFDLNAQQFTDADSAALFLNELVDRDDLTKETDLSSALLVADQLRQDQPIAAALVLSDMAHNHPGQRKPTEVATNLGTIPVYVVPIGNESRLRDIDLVSLSAPAVAMRNDDVVIEANLGIYQCLGESCTVQLLRDGKVVDFRNVLIDSETESRSVQFEQRVSEVGLASFQVAVEPLDGEMTNENNFDEIEINVTRSDIKVLLADEMPRWEYRYLAQLFRRDPKVEVDELLFHPRVIATGRRAQTKTFPVTVDQWDQYDVVILGDLQVEHFPVAAQESLLNYLRRRGGTLVMIAGQTAMPQAYVDHPIHEVIPVRPISEESLLGTNQYAFRVTPEGQSHVALMIGETEQSTRDAWEFVNRFSPLQQVSAWRTPLPTARSLIAAVPRDVDVKGSDEALAESTFLCWQPVGRGRIVYLSGPDTYRLRFLRGDQLHYRFWGQLMRWAIAADLSTGNRSVRIRTDRTMYETDQSVDLVVELLDTDGNPVVHDQPDREELRVSLRSAQLDREIPVVADDQRPGHYRAEVQDLPPGVYQAVPGGSLVEELLSEQPDSVGGEQTDAVATFTVQADLPTELVDTRCNRVLASQITQLTGAQVLPPTAVDEILALTDLQPVVTHRVQRQPLWLRWKYLWLVFGCLQTEWIIRKWRGLS